MQQSLTTPWVEGRLSAPPSTIEVLGFLKTEIKRNPQGNLQTDFLKLMLQHKGKEGLLNWLGDWLCLAACISLETKQACMKRQAFEKRWAFGKREACRIFHFRAGRLPFPAALPGNCVCAFAKGARWWTAHYHHPRKVGERSNLDQLHMRVSSLSRKTEGRKINYLCVFE